jgi:hypothetical protein
MRPQGGRPLKLDDWGISWEAYKELSYFCLQYQQKKRQAAALLTIASSTASPVTYHINGKEYGVFLPHGNKVSDPVSATAERREKLLDDVRMIEKAARLTCEVEHPGAYDALLRAVTTRGGVQQIMRDCKTKPPMGERQLYALRRRFFVALYEMREKLALTEKQ